MYDWKKIIEDRVPCFFWDKLEYNLRECGYLSSFTTFFYADVVGDENIKYEFCEPIRTEDKEKYTIKEPVKVWRACKTWEEFKSFMGKIAIHKNRNPCFMIISCLDAEYTFSMQWWFENYTLEDGSPIGVEEVQE